MSEKKYIGRVLLIEHYVVPWWVELSDAKNSMSNHKLGMFMSVRFS